MCKLSVYLCKHWPVLFLGTLPKSVYTYIYYRNMHNCTSNTRKCNWIRTNKTHLKYETNFSKKKKKRMVRAWSLSYNLRHYILISKDTIFTYIYITVKCTKDTLNINGCGYHPYRYIVGNIMKVNIIHLGKCKQIKFPFTQCAVLVIQYIHYLYRMCCFSILFLYKIYPWNFKDFPFVILKCYITDYTISHR